MAVDNTVTSEWKWLEMTRGHRNLAKIRPMPALGMKSMGRT